MNVSNAAINVRAPLLMEMLEFRRCIASGLQAIEWCDLVKELFGWVDRYSMIGKMKHHITVANRPSAQKAATMTSSKFVTMVTSRGPAGFAASPR